MTTILLLDLIFKWINSFFFLELKVIHVPFAVVGCVLFEKRIGQEKEKMIVLFITTGRKERKRKFCFALLNDIIFLSMTRCILFFFLSKHAMCYHFLPC